LIENYLANASKVTVGQVAKEAIGMEAAKIGTADQRRITAVMGRVGWKRDPKKDWKGNRWWTR
jgi:hypothetical protein